MKLKGKNIWIHDSLRPSSLKGLCQMGDYLIEDYDNLRAEALREGSRSVPKLYAYEIRNHNDQTEAVIVFKIISMLNEYKLASLHFISDNEASLIEGIEMLLEHQILKNSMLKIVASPDNARSSFILEHLGFVKNKEENNKVEYKITKPIFMKGR